MAQYSDYLILAGLVLCVLSVIYAIIQLVRLQPPRAAAITLILGIVLIFAGALSSPQGFSLQDIRGVWGRVSGQTETTTPVEENTDGQVSP